MCLLILVDNISRRIFTDGDRRADVTLISPAKIETYSDIEFYSFIQDRRET